MTSKMLSEITSVITKGTTPTSVGCSFSKNGINYIKSESITSSRTLDKSKYAFISEETHQKLKRSQIKENDILFSMAGMFLGKTGIVQADDVPANTNQAVAIIRIVPEQANYLYVYYYLNQKNIVTWINSLSGQSAQPNINLKQIGEIEIPLPDRIIQDTIVEMLSAIDSRIELNTAINENLEQQAQALFKAWFVDFEPFGGVMPDDWKIISLGKLCDSISKKHKFNKDELIFLNTGDVENGMILHNNYSEVSQMPGQAKKSIAINDILYSEIRPINKHFAYVNFVADDYVVSTKLMVLRAKGISPRRLYQFLTMPDTLKELQVEAESRSGTFPQIRFDNIQQLEMIVASEQVEKEYSERLNTIYSMIDTNNSENKRLSALRDTLLPKLMNGEIDVSAVKI